MPEQTQDLRELLVILIHKARNPNPANSTKSILIFSVTWVLWFLTALTLRDHQTLMYSPIIGNLALGDLAGRAAVVVLVQLNILLAWSIISIRKSKKNIWPKAVTRPSENLYSDGLSISKPPQKKVPIYTNLVYD